MPNKRNRSITPPSSQAPIPPKSRRDLNGKRRRRGTRNVPSLTLAPAADFPSPPRDSSPDIEIIASNVAPVQPGTKKFTAMQAPRVAAGPKPTAPKPTKRDIIQKLADAPDRKEREEPRRMSRLPSTSAVVPFVAPEPIQDANADDEEDDGDDDLNEDTPEPQPLPWDVGPLVFMGGNLDLPWLDQFDQPIAPALDGPCRPTYTLSDPATGNTVHIWLRGRNDFVNIDIVEEFALEFNPLTSTRISFFPSERRQWIFVEEAIQACQCGMDVVVFRNLVDDDVKRLVAERIDAVEKPDEARTTLVAGKRDLACEKGSERLEETLANLSLSVQLTDPAPFFCFDAFFRDSPLIRPLGCCNRVFPTNRIPALVDWHTNLARCYGPMNYSWLIVRKGFQAEREPETKIWDKRTTPLNIAIENLGTVGKVFVLEGGARLQRKAISLKPTRKKMLKRKIPSESAWFAILERGTRLKDAVIPFSFGEGSVERAWDYWILVTGFKEPEKKKEPAWGKRIERRGRRWRK